MRKLFRGLCCVVMCVIFSFAFSGCAAIEDFFSDLFDDWFGEEAPPAESGTESGVHSGTHNHSGTESGVHSGSVIETGELSIHFLELGNKYTGDCVLIKMGNVEALIDAGSRKSSAATITAYVDNYCTDGVLDYVIATHAHQDHIAGFVGTATAEGVFKHYEVENIIDFANSTNATSAIYGDYCDERDAEIAAGAKYYKAIDCAKQANNAPSVFTLGTGVSMKILYNWYQEYDNAVPSTSAYDTDDENDFSVCVLLTQGNNNYLFTGDLEGAGEAKLVQNNLLPKCKLYKGGHHGSATSSSEALLSVIQPEVVCVCTCCGTEEYTSNDAAIFPTQAFINHVAPYTDKIYVTTLINDYDAGDYTSMNGNIVVTSTGGALNVNCSNNNTVLKETAWFKANRVWPTPTSGG